MVGRILVLRNLRKAEARESEHLVGTKPPQVATLHPLNPIQPGVKRLVASLTTLSRRGHVT